MSGIINDESLAGLLKDPVNFQQIFWPNSVLTDYQVEILKSVQENKITVVPAGNKLGKDYVAAFCGIHFFCSRMPCRVVTTSVDGSQLNGVLWGEIRNFLQTAAFPLPVHVNHQQLRQKMPDGTLRGNSEFIGRVVEKGEGLLGRHLPYGPNMEPRVLCIIDEASGFDDGNYMGIDTWAHRILIIGNPFPCENFFKRLVQGGDKLSDAPHLKHDVKVIKVEAKMSPNVRLAHEEERLGRPLSRRIIVPGCMDIDDFNWRVKTYDPIKLAAGIYAEFYEGEEVRLFPDEWLRISNEQADKLHRSPPKERRTLPRAMGIDTAEGGDNTVWTIVDRMGMLYQLSKRTRNTAVIKGQTIALMREYGIEPEGVMFDHGGGGKEHADYLRDAGYDVRSVGFGESPSSPDEFIPGWVDPDDKKDLKQEKYIYKNKRAQLYGVLRQVLDPNTKGESDVNNPVFGIPEKYGEVLRQLRPLPLKYDGEGRMFLPPKNKPTPNYKGDTIKDLIGHSPDESDSLALAVFSLVCKPTIITIGGF